MILLSSPARPRNKHNPRTLFLHLLALLHLVCRLAFLHLVSHLLVLRPHLVRRTLLARKV
jgi:hypothetical protein